MVKTYLRYEQHSSFGVISSANALFGSKGKIAITAALEDIVLWNIRQGVKVQTLHHNTIKGHVTVLALSPDSVVLAAGYSDGTVCLWDYQVAAGEDLNPSVVAPAPSTVFRTMLSGHRSEVTTLSFSSDGATLVSGSSDTDLIVWDVLAEKGTMKLSGHRNAITAVKILDTESKVFSGSRDGMVKVWDLDTQRCVQTLVGHHNPVWALTISPDNTTLVTGSTDKMLRIWKLGETASEFAIKKEDAEEEEGEETNDENYAQFFGTMTRSSVYKDHVGHLEFNKTGTLLACQGSETTLDIFSAFSKQEVDESRVVKMEDEDEDEKPTGYNPLDFFVPLESLTTTEKIKSFSFDSLTPTRQFMLALGNNSVQIYKLGAQTQDALEEQRRNEVPAVQSSLFSTLDFEGHPADIRFLALSYDDTQILSVSTSCAKIFSSKTRKCTRTIPVENAICGSFIPGVIGTKIGKLFVVELASGVVEEVEGAHASILWSICIFPNGQGLATASADKTVKFWAFEMKKDGPVTLSLVKTLQVESEATCVCISPNSKHVAVSLMDYTVSIFSMSTFKKFLSLYGHKLPVLSMTISSDSALIATGSADKNIKIWGMDFGDCHKSIFAHDGSVTQVAFVPNTHYLFTTGKDKLVKYWDADKFDLVQTLKGHHSEVWGLAVSSSGRFVISSSHDRSIRLWEQTDEQLFPEEERENEQDAMFEEALLEERPIDPDDPTAPRGVETTRPSRVTTEAVKGSERVTEALGFLEDPESTLALAMLRGRSPEDYVFHTISSLRAADVEEALLLLPYAQLEPMLRVLDAQAAKANMRTLETLCRTVFFLLSIHQKQLTLDTKLLPRLLSLNERVKGALTGYKRVVGVNKAAMGILQKELENTEEGFQPLFRIEELRESKQRKQKRPKKSNK